MSVASWYAHTVIDLTKDTGDLAVDIANHWVSAAGATALGNDLVNLGAASLAMTNASTIGQVLATFTTVQGELLQMVADEKTYLTHAWDIKWDTKDLQTDYTQEAVAQELLIIQHNYPLS